MADEPAPLHCPTPRDTPRHAGSSAHNRAHVPSPRSQMMTHLHLSGYRLLLAKYMLLRASQTLDARPAEEAEEQAALPGVRTAGDEQEQD